MQTLPTNCAEFNTAIRILPTYNTRSGMKHFLFNSIILLMLISTLLSLSAMQKTVFAPEVQKYQKKLAQEVLAKKEDIRFITDIIKQACTYGDQSQLHDIFSIVLSQVAEQKDLKALELISRILRQQCYAFNSASIKKFTEFLKQLFENHSSLLDRSVAKETVQFYEELQKNNVGAVAIAVNASENSEPASGSAPNTQTKSDADSNQPVPQKKNSEAPVFVTSSESPALNEPAASSASNAQTKSGADSVQADEGRRPDVQTLLLAERRRRQENAKFEQKLEGLDTKMDTVKTELTQKIDHLDGRMTTVSNRVDTLNTNVTTLTANVTTVSAEVSSMNGKVDRLVNALVDPNTGQRRQDGWLTGCSLL